MPDLVISLVALGPDDSEDDATSERLEISLGEGELPPPFEEALNDAPVGDVVEMDFAAGELFGEYDPENILAVPRDQFADDVALEKGGAVEVTIEPDEEDDPELEEEQIEARIVEVNDEVVVLDLNPPLAGKPVTLRAEILERAD